MVKTSNIPAKNQREFQIWREYQKLRFVQWWKAVRSPTMAGHMLGAVAGFISAMVGIHYDPSPQTFTKIWHAALIGAGGYLVLMFGLALIKASGVSARIHYEQSQRIKELTEELKIIKENSIPFEIIFDPKNPGHQYWSPNIIKTFSADIPCIEYRIRVRNMTNKTLYEVKAERQTFGKMSVGTKPERLTFDQTGKDTFTLDPGASALITLLREPTTNTSPARFSSEKTSVYGPLKVTVSALNVQSVERIFNFNPLREPMIS